MYNIHKTYIPEFHGLFTDAGRVTRVDDVGHVLVGLRGLLHHQLGGSHAHRYALKKKKGIPESVFLDEGQEASGGVSYFANFLMNLDQ